MSTILEPPMHRLAFSGGSWSPILSGTRRTLAAAVVRDIAQALPPPFAKESDPSLGGGDAGYALFHAYYVRSGMLDEQECLRHHELMMDHLQSALDKLSSIAHRPDLISGISGVAWTINHLRNVAGLGNCDEVCDAIDCALLDMLTDRSDSMLCELLLGLSGVGLYALGRRPRPTGRKLGEQVVRALGRSTVEHQGFRTWFNHPEKLSAIARQATPNGCYNLGMSHGVPGAIAFLAQAAAVGTPLAGELVSEACAWLLAQQRRYPNGSLFAYGFLSDPLEAAVPVGTRVSWCYGDLGVASALLLSARCVNNRELEVSALEIARSAARRAVDLDATKDAALCHGAFGNAHIFNRLYVATHEDCFLEAALRWATAGFAMRREGLGLAGFRAWVPDRGSGTRKEPWCAEPGLLEGICGIGLALLGMMSPVEPSWDKVFMVNIPR